MCKRMRTWDEDAKDPDAVVPPLEAYKARVLAAIKRLPVPASDTLDHTSFVRDGEAANVKLLCGHTIFVGNVIVGVKKLI